MPLTLDAFRSIANNAVITSRDIEIHGKGANATARLGAYVFSAGTMAAFKAALEKEYGVFGTHAFDTVLGARSQMHKSLRACDVKAALSKLDSVKQMRFAGELNRQLDTNPKFRMLSPELRQEIRTAIASEPFKGVDPKACKSQADIAHMAVKRLNDAIHDKRTGDAGEDIALGGRKKVEQESGAREPTGLRNLKKVFNDKETSVEDRIKRGVLGSGMRVNRSDTNPVLLDKLKTNGVEPGFIFRNDWRKALDELKAKNPDLAARCEGKTLREQIMLAGRAHPAGMAAAAEFVLEEAVRLALQPDRMKNHPFADLAKALQNYFAPQDLQRLDGAVSDPKNKAILQEAKTELFTEIRDAVMNVGPNEDFHTFSPIFKHFSDRAIVKLDYNESAKFSSGDTASAGTFMRPERVAVGRKMGQLYRFTSRGHDLRRRGHRGARERPHAHRGRPLAGARDRPRAVFRRTPQDHARREVRRRLQGPRGRDAQGRPRREAQGRAEVPPDGEPRQVQGVLPRHGRPRRHRQARSEQGLRGRQVLRHRPRPLARGQRQVPQDLRRPLLPGHLRQEHQAALQQLLRLRRRHVLLQDGGRRQPPPARRGRRVQEGLRRLPRRVRPEGEGHLRRRSR